ncbi:hypothetical protein AALO_G00170290 [Alosa alosa]|uniref:Protein phosphatase 1 regulatory subunit 26 N-terminal domain-containing protein n=1 Tax=Alosa alosa TaxID=278164 RepID=A0AAV6GCN5_9TELE|nr:protein phosphatase 1 regulatory subunit 26 isoform X1 [Alosa alosa]KAG5272879.1 hypothetical protein AALO_G00170290 [Alosa alosa]
MFLKSVPPAVAIHSDWRSVGSVSSVGGGAPQSLGLPLCFNDSDSSLSSSGTPIHQKVQMIIETLRTTQSSVDTSDGGQMEGTGSSAHSSRESLRQPGHKMKTGPSGSRGGATMDCRPPSPLPCTKPERQDSDTDSDSSVDRGIEEAIQEYLKEKVDHKRKAEPSPVRTSPAAKLPRRDTVVTADNSHPQSCSDGNKVLTASNHILKNSKGGVTPVANLKKKLKKKRPSKENPVKKPAVTMLSFLKKLPSLDQRGASSTLPHPDKAQPSLVVKTEELLDASSSSDDGIEEEIQRYQQQKNREQLQLSRPQIKKEDSDSSSDDGIEEAIRRFQQEKKQKEIVPQKKKKSTVKQSQLKNATPGAKVGLLNTDRTEIMSGKKASKPTTPGPTKRKKKEKPRTDGKLSVPGFSPDRPASLGSPSSDGLNARGPVAPPSRLEPTPVPMLKVNTTAELMCAEAILDISKAVMPITFDPSPHPLDPTLLVHSTAPPLSSKDPSDAESSVDSEDGIELEIRKFLEQKAQMQKETPAAPATTQEPPKTTLRPKPPTESEKGDQSEDKSSSLDSDEDLDAAIKDLLKTKKRVKRKMKKAPTKPVVTSSTTQPSKKHKPPTDPNVKTAKSGLSKGGKKKSSQVKNKNPHQAVRSPQDIKQENKSKSPSPQAKPPRLDTTEGGGAGTGIPDCLTSKEREEDSSSVDSDDSIEQEIRKFLAERANGGGGNTSKTTITTPTSSSTPTAAVKTEETEGKHQDQNHSKAISPPRAFKLEDQQAEIPLDLGMPCPDAQQGVWQKPDGSRESQATVEIPARDRLSHSMATSCKGERKRGFEERRVLNVGSPPGDKPHLHPDCDVPNSRTHTLTHTPSRTHGVIRHLPNRTQTPSSPNEIPPTQTTPCPARTNNPGTASLPGLNQSSRPSISDSCGRNTVCSTSLPPVTFYRSSMETPVSRDSLGPHVGAPDSRLQGGGKRGRWDQPPALQAQQPGGCTLLKNQGVLQGQSAQQASCSQARGRQEREGKKEGGEREGQTEVRKVTREEELVDETDLDSEEEERRHGERQREGRQQRFPSVSLERTIDPGIVLSPYIILSTEERSRKACKVQIQVPNKCRLVKRKLQFVVCTTKREATEK